MAVGLDLSRALRVGAGGHDLRQIGRAGATVWTLGLLPLGLYGTGLGQVPIHLRPEDAVLGGGGSVSALPNRGGAGAYFDTTVGEGTITRAGKLLTITQSYLRLAMPADLVGVHAFMVVSSSQTSGNHMVLGRSAGNNDGDKTSLMWQAAFPRFTPDRWNGSTFPSGGLLATSILPSLSLIEIHLSASAVTMWRNGVPTAPNAHGFPNFLIDRIGAGRSGPSFVGQIGDVVSLITDGTAARDGAVSAIRQHLSGKYGITLG